MPSIDALQSRGLRTLRPGAFRIASDHEIKARAEHLRLVPMHDAAVLGRLKIHPIDIPRAALAALRSAEAELEATTFHRADLAMTSQGFFVIPDATGVPIGFAVMAYGDTPALDHAAGGVVIVRPDGTLIRERVLDYKI